MFLHLVIPYGSFKSNHPTIADEIVFYDFNSKDINNFDTEEFKKNINDERFNSETDNVKNRMVAEYIIENFKNKYDVRPLLRKISTKLSTAGTITDSMRYMEEAPYVEDNIFIYGTSYGISLHNPHSKSTKNLIAGMFKIIEPYDVFITLVSDSNISPAIFKQLKKEKVSFKTIASGLWYSNKVLV